MIFQRGISGIRCQRCPSRSTKGRVGDLVLPLCVLQDEKAALSDPEFNKWLEALNMEMQSIKDNQVWVLVDLPPNGQTVRSKWLFKKKTDMDGNVHTFKVRLVAKDLGEATYILGIKIICDRSKRLIDLSQSAYLEKILKKFWMENSKKRYTPLIEKADYRKSQGAKTPTEYIAAAEASMEAVWMRKFIVGLGGAVPLNKRPMEMLCDNEPTIAIANDPGILKGARHFQMKYHYIREVIQEREIFLKKIHTYDNVANPFTKPMPFNKHYEHAMVIGIVPASISGSIDDVARLFINVSYLDNYFQHGDLCEEVSNFVKESKDVVMEVERLSCKDVAKETIRLLRREQKRDLYKMTHL
ncbi:hypothetical protein Tco_0774569 [Tanacetum coccineum]|uniref:Reverse transcriptase Ty1/copia-type domain-containing protein n=1 Tax=Tanacetum coccineum TaxID=301880 RepID=A0ABQ4ZNW0_9ASTR